MNKKPSGPPSSWLLRGRMGSPARSLSARQEETRALELFRQIRPAQKKVALLSVILSALAAETTT